MFLISRVATEGKGIILLFWGLWNFLYDAMIFDFKFGSNRTAGSEDTIRFVVAHGRNCAIRLPVVSDLGVSYVSGI